MVQYLHNYKVKKYLTMQKRDKTKQSTDKQTTSIEDQNIATDNADVVDDNMAESKVVETDNTSQVADEEPDWRDRFLRLSAEFDNYRKRTLREKMELVESGGEDVIKALLPVLDDLDRALAATETASDVEAVREGIVLIANKLHEALHSKGVSAIEAISHELDTDMHEAVARFAAGKKHRGKIVDVVQKGYKLKDKVIRHARVVVGE